MLLLYKEQTEGETGCRVCKQVMQMEKGKSKSLTSQEMQRKKKKKKVEARWRANRFPDTTHTAVTLSDGSWADTHVMLADRENNNCLPPLYQELHCRDCGGEPDSNSRWALLAGLMITLTTATWSLRRPIGNHTFKSLNLHIVRWNKAVGLTFRFTSHLQGHFLFISPRHESRYWG